MQNIALAWIRQGKQLTHIGACVEKVIGWTPEEIQEKPLRELIAPATFQYMKAYYYVGPPNTIVPRAFPIGLLHKDGHEVRCRAIIVCRYDDSGDLAEAWGCLQCHNFQCQQDRLLEWWPEATPQALEMMTRVIECYT